MKKNNFNYNLPFDSFSNANTCHYDIVNIIWHNSPQEICQNIAFISDRNLIDH